VDGFYALHDALDRENDPQRAAWGLCRAVPPQRHEGSARRGTWLETHDEDWCAAWKRGEGVLNEIFEPIWSELSSSDRIEWVMNHIQGQEKDKILDILLQDREIRQRQYNAGRGTL
jgi:hypothetical protein